MDVTGRCHCGEITYRATVDPDQVKVCHCTDCQTFASAPFRTVLPIPDSDFHLLTGTPKIYVKIAESGNERQQAFCPTCGTPLYATANGPSPRVIGLRTGSIEGGAALAPKQQVWMRSTLAWLKDVLGLPGAQKTN